MTDRHDDAARDLVQRAHHSDPEPAGLDVRAGLADVLARSGQQAPSRAQSAGEATRPSARADPTRRGDGPAQKDSSEGDQHAPEPARAAWLTRAPAGQAMLSNRERQIAELILKGLSYRQIGKQLVISTRTVEHHVAQMRQRLHAHSRDELFTQLRAFVSATVPQPTSQRPAPTRPAPGSRGRT
jgi:DNA-binding CsgD family transcriptional regulator